VSPTPRAPTRKQFREQLSEARGAGFLAQQRHVAQVNNPIIPVDDLAITGGNPQIKLATDEAFPVMALLVGEGPDKPHAVKTTQNGGLVVAELSTQVLTIRNVGDVAIAGGAVYSTNQAVNLPILGIISADLSWSISNATAFLGALRMLVVDANGILVWGSPFIEATGVYDGQSYKAVGLWSRTYSAPTTMTSPGNFASPLTTQIVNGTSVTGTFSWEVAGL
jgi:hypothetical protein